MNRNLQKHDDIGGKFISAEDVALLDKSEVELQAKKLTGIAQSCKISQDTRLFIFSLTPLPLH